MKNSIILLIIDGFGIAPEGKGNAISIAETSELDRIFSENPVTKLKCSGLDVGLPDGQMGNSEVGHTNIGAGRVVFQDLPRISNQIKDGTFFQNPALLKAVETCKSAGSALHLLGLLSDGGVHSHIDHLFALLELAKQHNLDKVYVHAFLDGRDTPPQSASAYVGQLESKMRELGVGKIATLCGRFYAMDRDKRWDRVEQAYNAMVCGEGIKNSNALDAVEKSYADGVTDEFVKPVVCDESGTVKSGDCIIAFDYRPDRMREIMYAFTQKNFDGFERKILPEIQYTCFTQYDASAENVEIAFEPASLGNIFGEYIAGLGYKQLRIAETEKYAHVTFFFNGGKEEKYNGEDRILIPSPKVATYDLQPEMSAYELTDAVCGAIKSRKYDVIIMNYANCDMVGHTGSIKAAVKAVETVSKCVARVVNENSSLGGITIITADHGNAEKMISEDGSPFTAHTTNPVPFCVVGADVTLKSGRLADIAPTILDLMGIEKPAEMDGNSLIEC